jgi:hypothetical protein
MSTSRLRRLFSSTAPSSLTIGAGKLANKKCLLISTVFPEPTSSAAGVRDFQLIELLQSEGCEVMLVSPAKETVQILKNVYPQM